jgi:predicted small lipoprotein YifL
MTAMRRALPALLVIPVLAFFAAGCGSGGALSLDPVASAASKTQQAGTYAFDYTASMQVLGQELSFSGSGQADTPNGRVHMTMDFKGLPAALTQDGTTAEMILVDKVMYMKMPFLASQLPAGKQWMKLDLATLASSAGTSLGSFNQADPQQWVQQLLASSDTQKIGTETVQGEQMTHYKTTIDPAKIDTVPADQRAAVRAAMKQIGMTTIPVDVWIDGQGLLRRESIDMTLGKALQNSRISMTFDMHDFGTAVDVTAPAADQVFDATALVQQQAGGNGSSSAQSEWATKANAVCRSIYRRYTALGNVYNPKTFAAKVKLAQGIVPIETDELAQLQAISGTKSAAATKAIALVRADLSEGRAAVAAAGNRTVFLRLWRVWNNDRRATNALGAAGASDCA